MGMIGSGTKDIAVAIKDMIVFFVAYTAAVFVAGQWFSHYVPYQSNAWWYPMYLLIAVLIMKILLDAFIKPEKKKGGDKKKK